MNDETRGSFQHRPDGRWLVAGMVLLGVATAGAWWQLLAVSGREDALAQRLEQQSSIAGERESALAAVDRDHRAVLDNLASEHAAMGKRVDTLLGARRSALLAGEADYLARLAAQRLALMQDPQGALALLEAADASLRDIRDADTHAARTAIARDLAQLRDAAAIDVDALYLRLAALADGVDQLADSRPGTTPAAPPPAAGVPAPADGSAWQRFLEVLSSLVHIRRTDAPIAPMVSAGERALAAQNFRLLVEQAQIALLQRRPVIYQHSLDQAARWLERIPAGDPQQRRVLAREIAALRAADRGNTLPGLTASVGATRALAARLLPETGGTP